MCFFPIFGVFLNVICYSKRMRILWYNVFGFVLSSEVKKLTRFAYSILSPFVTQKNNFSFLINYKHQVEFFLPILFNILALNKRNR